MSLEEFISTGIPALGAAIAVAWFLWQRYLSLEKRFQAVDCRLSEVDLKIVQLDHGLKMSRSAFQSKEDHHGYLINSNTQLINHRTDRFMSEIKALEERLTRDLDDIKGFLDKTTEFKIRQ